MSLLMIHEAYMPVYRCPDDWRGRAGSSEVVQEALADLKSSGRVAGTRQTLPRINIFAYSQKTQLIQNLSSCWDLAVRNIWNEKNGFLWKDILEKKQTVDKYREEDVLCPFL